MVVNMNNVMMPRFFLCPEDSDVVVDDINGNPVSVTHAVEGGRLNTSETDQWSFGLALQSAFNQSLWGHDNQFVYDLSRVAYSADTELGSLIDDWDIDDSGILVNESRVRLDTTTNSFGLFFTEVFNVTEQLAINVAGCYNHVEIDMQDHFGTELTGKHKFDRFNPAAGLTYSFRPEINFYGGYSESSRVPTRMELSCADPDAPCKLLNAFIADSPLEQVVAKSWEAVLEDIFLMCWMERFSGTSANIIPLTIAILYFKVLARRIAQVILIMLDSLRGRVSN